MGVAEYGTFVRRGAIRGLRPARDGRRPAGGLADSRARLARLRREQPALRSLGEEAPLANIAARLTMAARRVDPSLVKTTLAAPKETASRHGRKPIMSKATHHGSARRKVTAQAGRVVIHKLSPGERITDEDMRRALDEQR